MQNIVAALFEVESEGYQAITSLKSNPVTDDYAILQMALVKREGDRISVCDSYDSGVDTIDDTALGGILGSMIGILGGPIGVLLMGSYGALAGSLFDLDDAISDNSLIEKVVDKLQDGTVSLVMLADEQNESALDTALGVFKADVLRYDAAVIAAEVDEANKMEQEMQRQALIKLRDTKKEEFKQKIEEKRSKIAADFENFKKSFAD